MRKELSQNSPRGNTCQILGTLNPAAIWDLPYRHSSPSNYTMQPPSPRVGVTIAAIILLLPVLIPVLLFSLCVFLVFSFFLFPATCIICVVILLRRFMAAPLLDDRGKNSVEISRGLHESRENKSTTDVTKATVRGLGADVDLSFWQIYLVRRVDGEPRKKKVLSFSLSLSINLSLYLYLLNFFRYARSSTSFCHSGRGGRKQGGEDFSLSLSLSLSRWL